MLNLMQASQNKTLKSQLLAFTQFIVVYGFLFNPWTSFPYTLIIIMVSIFVLTYWEDQILLRIGFKWDINILNTIDTGLLLFVFTVPAFDFIVQPLINKLTGEIADYSAFQSLANNFPKYLKYLFSVIISATFGEEILFRGFFFRQFQIFLPEFKFKTVFMILFSAILFSIAHLHQGLNGLIMTFIFGVLFGTIYIKTNFNLWVTIIVHALFDLMFLTLAYFDILEYYVLGNNLIFGY